MKKHLLTQHFQSSHGMIAFDSEGEGPDVVLVHGTPTNSVIWRAVIDRLKTKYRFHYLDLPGYGASEKREGQDVRLRSFARVVREFAEHQRLERPHLVGHDFGAAAVLGALLVEGLSVASIAIADGVVLNPWGTKFSLHVKQYEKVFAAVPVNIHWAIITAHIATALSRPLTPELTTALMEPWTGEVGQAAYYRQVAMYDHDYTGKLEGLYPKIDVPTLVLWGEEDRWVDIAVGRKLQALIPGAKFETLPDAGHFSMLDCPQLFARLLGEWLNGTDLPDILYQTQ